MQQEAPTWLPPLSCTNVDIEVDKWVFVQVLRGRDFAHIGEAVSSPYCEVELHGVLGTTKVRIMFEKLSKISKI